MKKRICMVVQDPMVKGGIAAVVNGYRGSKLEKDYDIIYVESYKDGNKFAKIYKAICGYLHYIKVILADKPSLVHIHSSFGPSFYRKIPFIYFAKFTGIPVINHIHGADFNQFYKNAGVIKRNIVREVYGKCTVLIALSQEWRDNLCQIVPSSRIRIIENYSILHEDALEDRINRQCNNRVLFLGELGRRKGCYDIPAVVKDVQNEIPDVRFVLCGSGADQEQVKTLFSSNVEFPGWVRNDEKDRLLRESDIFFLPSYNEGMPMSVLDAMGYGLPIVSTKVGGIPRIVTGNGVCCNPGDTKAMSQAIITYLKDNCVRSEAGKASLDIVKSHFLLESHLAKLKKLYEEV